MDKELIIRYAPFTIVVISLLFQWNLFVTPEKLEIKHREILQDISQRYSTKEQHNDLKQQLNDIQSKVDKMYDIIAARYNNHI